MTTPVILASTSKTRSKLLHNADIEHEVIPACIDEELIKASLVAEGMVPRDMADALAEQKAKRISLKYPSALVIGSDQTLDFQGQAYSKSTSPECLAKFLAKLCGKEHTLYAAAVIYHNGNPTWRHIGRATLTMRKLSHEYITHEEHFLFDVHLHDGGGADLLGWSVAAAAQTT